MFNLEIKDQEICAFIIKLGNKELQRAFQVSNKEKMEVIPEEEKNDVKLDGDEKKKEEEKNN